MNCAISVEDSAIRCTVMNWGISVGFHIAWGKLNKKCKGVLELSNQKADEVENEDLDVEKLSYRSRWMWIVCAVRPTKKRELHI